MCWPNSKYISLNYNFSDIVIDSSGCIYAVYIREEDKISLDISNYVYGRENMLNILDKIEEDCKSIKCTDAEEIRDKLKAILQANYKT
jgi:hypothetical protein